MDCAVGNNFEIRFGVQDARHTLRVCASTIGLRTFPNENTPRIRSTSPPYDRIAGSRKIWPRDVTAMVVSKGDVAESKANPGWFFECSVIPQRICVTKCEAMNPRRRFLLLSVFLLRSGFGFAQQADAPTAIQNRPQPKRILGIMPNYPAVSPGQIAPPPTPKDAFKIASENSFDYSAFLFGGLTTLIAEVTNRHPQFGKGVDGFGRYYWRGFVDRTDGNYLVLFALPTVFHQDERYYASGTGNIGRRAVYAASRVLITPNYRGQETFNASEVFGRGIAQAVSTSYYPNAARTASSVVVKLAWALGRDAMANVFREFWPDIAAHVAHRGP